MNSVSLTCCKPRGLHQHGLDQGSDPQIDASARRCAGLGTSFNVYTHTMLTLGDPLDCVNGEAGMIASRSR